MSSYINIRISVLFCVSPIVLIKVFLYENCPTKISTIRARDEHEGKEKSLSMDTHISGVLMLWTPLEDSASYRYMWGGGAGLWLISS